MHLNHVFRSFCIDAGWKEMPNQSEENDMFIYYSLLHAMNSMKQLNESIGE